MSLSKLFDSKLLKKIIIIYYISWKLKNVYVQEVGVYILKLL